MDNTSIQKIDLVGPRISGTVTVPLLELDKMRMDHSNAVKIASELTERQAMVKVTFVQRVSEYGYQSTGGGRNRYLKDDSLQESAVEYKNFDDFREIIRQEEHDKIHQQFLEFVRKQQELEDKLVEKQKLLEKLNSDLTVAKKANGELITQNESLKKEVEITTKKAVDLEIDYQNQVRISDGINESLKRSFKDLDECLATKSFWHYIYTKLR